MLHPTVVSVLGWGSEEWHWMSSREEVSLVTKFSYLGRVTDKSNDDLCVSSCRAGSIHISGHVVNGMISRAAS